MLFIRSTWLVLAVIFSLTSLLFSQDEYRYSYMPKKVYENQLFPVTVVGPDESPTFTFDTSSTTQPLFRKPLVVKNANDIFYTFYFKAAKVDVQIPRLFIHSDMLESSLDDRSITLGTLSIPEDFSEVLAAEMKIKKHQVSNFDGKNHMITLSIEAYEANMEDMILNHTNESGVENIKRDGAKVSAELYAVLPREEKELRFSYYNTIKKCFISLAIPVNVADASVTTQSDLHPRVDAFKQLKRYALITFSVFFMIMFLWKRDFFYLILGVISIITVITFYIPHKKICIKQGTALYILPTNTSTIGTRISYKLDTMLLGERANFKKIEYEKGIIGWVHAKDICKP